MKILEPGVNLLIRLSHGISGLPGAHYNPPPMPLGLLLIATFGFLVFGFMRGTRRWAGLAAMLTALVLGFFQPRPVAFFSPRGDQAGFLQDEPSALFVASADKPDKFMAAFWGERLGVAEDEIHYADDDNVPPLSCTPSRCVWNGNGKTLAWVRDVEALPAECAAGHAVIINFRNDQVCGESATRVLTKQDFREHGAHAVYKMPAGFVIEAARSARALRPWNTGWRPEERRRQNDQG